MKTAIIQDGETLQIVTVGTISDKASADLKDKNIITISDENGNEHVLSELEILSFTEYKSHWLIKAKKTMIEASNEERAAFLDYLSNIIAERKSSATEASYTARLFEKGINKIAQKVGEEAVELVIEAKDDNKDLFLGEAADLLFHFLVLLEAKQIKLHEVIEVLQKRHNK